MPIDVSRQERGNITLYVIVIIPLVLSLAVLAVDVSRFHILRDAAQKEADRIALQAAQSLPDVGRARGLIIESAASLQELELAKGEDLSPVLEISNSRVALSLQGDVTALLDIFMRKADGSGHVFRVNESSEAQLVPSDTVLIMADASSLRPPKGENWGEESLWPASQYFNYVQPPALEDLPAADTADARYWPQWWKSWQSSAYRRWATQSCYNPLYSGLKSAAISFIDTLGTVDTNRLSLLFTPGDIPADGFTVSCRLDFLTGGKSEVQARWLAYFEAQSFISDEACVYFGDPGLTSSANYQMPSEPSFAPVKTGSDCLSKYNELDLGQSYFLPSGKLSECFTTKELTLREAVYYHAARSYAHDPLGKNIVRALEQAYLQLLIADDEQKQLADARRGNLADKALRKVVLLTDYLPQADAEGLYNILFLLHQAKAVVVFLPYMPQDTLLGMKNLPQRTELIMNRAQQLAKFEQLNLKVLPVFQSAELSQKVIPAVIALGREVAIRS